MSSKKVSPQEAGDGNETVCVVCFKPYEVQSIGVCDHPVCFECSTRMRVLCQQVECPICRQEMPKVIFTKSSDPFSTTFQKYQNTNLIERKYGIYFCSYEIQKAYEKLLEHRCTICEQTVRFRNFSNLKDHMRKEHFLFYCDLCVDNLKIFSFERRCYTRSDLAYHRRKGDKDDTSHRGHPLCEFCEQRYMDNDELFRHLRRSHLYCHFCDTDGVYQYYSTIEDMCKHFREMHHLCEEGSCQADPLTSVFRTEIDLKAHITTTHSKTMSKSATKQARTLELQFTLPPRPRVGDNSRSFNSNLINNRNDNEGAFGYNMEPGGPGGGGTYTLEPSFVNSLAPQNFPALSGSNGGTSTSSSAVSSRGTTTVNFLSKMNPTLTDNDFPSLGNSTSRTTPGLTITTKSSAPSNNNRVVTIKTVRGGTSSAGPSGQRLAKTAENFPPLGSNSTPGPSSTVHLSLNSNTTDAKAPKVSIHVKPNGTTVTTHITTNATVRPSSNIDFPSLLGGKTLVSSSKPQWVQQKLKKQEPKVKKVAAPPQLPPSDLSQFPTLSKPAKADSKKTKKTSSVTVPITDNWVAGSSGDDNSKVSTNKGKPQEQSEVKSKNKKKKSNNNNNTKSNNEVITNGGDTSKNEVPVKKLSELKIGTLKSPEEDSSVKPPPGFSGVVNPPPGFNNFPPLSGSNDLTFTNSTGQSYAITPTSSYQRPANFSNRNQNLIKRVLRVLKNEEIEQFKLYSDSFRNGTYTPEQYYEHCRSILGLTFDRIFPELLVLLPDIEKQQGLFKLYENNGELVSCENCKQIVFKKELTEHYGHHVMDSVFPSLGKATQMNWKK